MVTTTWESLREIASQYQFDTVQSGADLLYRLYLLQGAIAFASPLLRSKFHEGDKISWLGFLPKEGKQTKCRSHLPTAISIDVPFNPNQYLTQAGFVVQVIIRKMKVSIHFSIIELHGDCVMGILVNGPN